MSVSGAFDEAVKGAAGFSHTATPLLDSADPNDMIPFVLKSTIGALESASRELKMNRFVLTSSSGATTAPKAGKVFTIGSYTWNEESITAAWDPGSYAGLQRLLDVYYASKTQQEQDAWNWVRDNSPGLVLNTVLPNAKFLACYQQGTSTISQHVGVDPFRLEKGIGV
jgi:nucleoside-diphosphate-sugar epimerase